LTLARQIAKPHCRENATVHVDHCGCFAAKENRDQ
jgi:hypothetical protein